MSNRSASPAIIVPESPPAAGHKRSRSPERSDSKEEKIDGESSSSSDGQGASKRRKVVDLSEGDGADQAVPMEGPPSPTAHPMEVSGARRGRKPRVSVRELNDIDALGTLTSEHDAMARELATVIAEHRNCKKLASDLYSAQLDRDSARVEVDTLRFNAEQDKKQKADQLALITKLTEQRDQAATDLKNSETLLHLRASDVSKAQNERREEAKRHEETKAQLVGEKAQRETLSEENKKLESQLKAREGKALPMQDCHVCQQPHLITEFRWLKTCRHATCVPYIQAQMARSVKLSDGPNQQLPHNIPCHFEPYAPCPLCPEIKCNVLPWDRAGVRDTFTWVGQEALQLLCPDFQFNSETLPKRPECHPADKPDSDCNYHNLPQHIWAFVHPLACQYINIKCPFSRRCESYFEEWVGESSYDRDFAEEALCEGTFHADVSRSTFCRNLVKHFYTECDAQVTFKFHGTGYLLDADHSGSSLGDFESTRNQALKKAFDAWIPSACMMPSITDSTPLVRADGKTTTQLQLRDLPGSGGKGGLRPPSTLQAAFLRAMEALGPDREWVVSGATPTGYQMPHRREQEFWEPMVQLEETNKTREAHYPGGNCILHCPLCPPPPALPAPMEDDVSASSNPPRSGRSIVPR